MCIPPLGPVGASPDDSQAVERASAAGASDTDRAAILARCLVSGRFARGRCASYCSRSRVWPRLPSAWPRARPRPSAHDRIGLRRPDQRPGRAVERHARPRRRARIRTAISSRSSPTPRARRSAASAPTATATSPASRLLGGLVTAERDRLAHLRRRPQGAGHGIVRGQRHRSRRRRRGRLGGARRPVRDSRHRLGRGRRAPDRALRRGLPRFRGRAPHPSLERLAQPPRGHRDPAGLLRRRREGHTAEPLPPADKSAATPSAPDALARARRRGPRPNPGLFGAPVVPLPAERRHADRLGRRRHPDRHRGAAAGRVHAHAARLSGHASSS